MKKTLLGKIKGLSYQKCRWLWQNSWLRDDGVYVKALRVCIAEFSFRMAIQDGFAGCLRKMFRQDSFWVG
jgi:hypothetical protein